MPLTAEQLAVRRKHLTATDMGALMGLDPFTSGGDVILSKKHNLVRDEGDNAPAELGHVCEDWLVDWAGKQMGIEFPIRQEIIVCDEHPIFSCTPDGLTEDRGTSADGKTSGVFWHTSEHWGDEHTDDVPDRVQVQVQTQMLCTGAKECAVPALIGGRGRLLFIVKRNDELIDDILATGQTIWKKHVEGDEPYTELPSLPALKRIRREPKSVCDISGELIDDWEQAKECTKIASMAADNAKAFLIAALGENEAGVAADGRMFTYLEQPRRNVPVKRLELQYPHVYEELVEVSKSRYARVKKAPPK